MRYHHCVGHWGLVGVWLPCSFMAHDRYLHHRNPHLKVDSRGGSKCLNEKQLEKDDCCRYHFWLAATLSRVDRQHIFKYGVSWMLSFRNFSFAIGLFTDCCYLAVRFSMYLASRRIKQLLCPVLFRIVPLNHLGWSCRERKCSLKFCGSLLTLL